MEIRRLLVVLKHQAIVEDTIQATPLLHVRNIIAALTARDVLLKCKAANAVGSLCISRVAGQHLLQGYGDAIGHSVAKMATRKNQWVQGDAFFVLGWIVVIAEETMLQKIAAFVPMVVACLHRNLHLPFEMDRRHVNETSRPTSSQRCKMALVSSEQASNFRVYALVLLLNLSQRDVNVFAHQLDHVFSMLRDLVVQLLTSAPRKARRDEATTAWVTTWFDPAEYVQLVRLAITLLSVLTDQIDQAAARLLELKTLPLLLRMKRALNTAEVRELMGEVDESQDLLARRLDALVQRLITCK
ncbi:hypothetical protein PsorP6_007055 [Peronosclerospora sorghi]|uniref:Uncharacterized protein n=1 Tax=Peronosclerospora sorghi TaxID=230839 RepID=A0ACC0WAS7_9STRA|nr:hypothetical protein PsorP6_007055 [Peronosclerospora sorghi]